MHKNVIGRIHSFETFGTVDGPGIRFVVFMQGCNFRCKFCHNPDTWFKNGGKEYTSTEVFEKILKYKTYYDSSNGGITISGGEPLLQIDFVTELFKLAKENGIHTAIDTAGDIDFEDKDSISKLDEVIKYTDLILLDIKEIDDIKHKELTGKSNKNTLKLAKYLNEKNIPVVIRYVYIKGVNDSEDTLNGLKEIKQSMSNIQEIDVLGYHKMGEYKWKELGIKNQFENIESPTLEETKKIKEFLNS